MKLGPGGAYVDPEGRIYTHAVGTLHIAYAGRDQVMITRWDGAAWEFMVGLGTKGDAQAEETVEQILERFARAQAEAPGPCEDEPEDTDGT